MSRYSVIIKEKAQADLKALSKNEPKAFQKALTLISELYDHPRTGTGKPEPLKGGDGIAWSRVDTKSECPVALYRYSVGYGCCYLRHRHGTTTIRAINNIFFMSIQSYFYLPILQT